MGVVCPVCHLLRRDNRWGGFAFPFLDPPGLPLANSVVFFWEADWQREWLYMFSLAVVGPCRVVRCGSYSCRAADPRPGPEQCSWFIPKSVRMSAISSSL